MSDFEEALCFRLYPLRKALQAVVATLDRSRQLHPGEDGFRQPAGFHLDRATRHLELLAAGDHSEPHLEHAATRLLMAIEAHTL